MTRHERLDREKDRDLLARLLDAIERLIAALEKKP
jgi:hypothetical protein